MVMFDAISEKIDVHYCAIFVSKVLLLLNVDCTATHG